MAKDKSKAKKPDGTDAGMAANDLNEALMGAISESNDPNARIKKLRHPIGPLSCLLNIVVLLVATIGFGLLFSSFFIDDFNLWFVFVDVLEKFKILPFFRMIGNFFANLFGGGGEEEAVSKLIMFGF
jgi:hypothetical protein